VILIGWPGSQFSSHIWELNCSHFGWKLGLKLILKFSPMWEPTRRTRIEISFFFIKTTKFSYENPNPVLKILNKLGSWFLLFFFSHGAAAIGSSCSSSHSGLLLFSSCYYIFPLTSIALLPLLFFSLSLLPLLFSHYYFSLFIAIILLLITITLLFPWLFLLSCCCC